MSKSAATGSCPRPDVTGYEIAAQPLIEHGDRGLHENGASVDGRLAQDGVLVISIPLNHVD